MALATAVATVVPLAGVTAPASEGATGKAVASSKAGDRSAIVPGRYIVMLKSAPLASYSGGVKGFARTKPLAGHRLNARSAAAKKYSRHLVAKHASVMSRAGLPARVIANNYTVAFNGFSARLTKAQAAKVAQTAGVAKVWPVEIRTADTISTPTFLGLEGDTGVWQQQFGGSANAGRGIIVADLDSGIWPESASFAKLAKVPDHKQIHAKWHGTCDKGVRNKIKCNNKLIGARFYGTAYGNDISDDFNSPRDFNGHGSHTASTAAGNHGVPADAMGIPLGDVSGMAPAARIAVYKVLWEDLEAGNASGTTDGIVAAIDDAVADGADVINYSISGSSTFIVTPDELAFLGAADAGVFVSASAGNSGPTASTVAHNAPWEMTVAASTHDRGATKTVTLGDGQTFTGVGVGPAVSGSLVDSVDVATATADPDEAELCFSEGSDGQPTLDPAKVSGKIVMCTRGVNARVDKSLAVKNAGGIGMILVNPTDQGVTADFHSVPSIHVNVEAYAPLKAYIASAGANATASISAVDTTLVEAPEMASFSSTGPALAGSGDLLKPDITAPGVSVIAAVAPPGNGGLSFNSYDGTSMAAPHITGIAALIKQKHPTWSPMWIKSALMTSATTLDNRGNPIRRAGADATPLDYGAGHVRPAPAFDPGLVYDSGYLDWLTYGCAIGQFQLVAGFCGQLPAIDPSDFNSPSIAIGALAGSQTVSRTVTNIAGSSSTYQATIQPPPGTTVEANTETLALSPGTSRSYSLTITRTDAPLNQWTFGSITWTDTKGHSVRSPIAVKPVALAAPTAVTGNGVSGSKEIGVTPGYTGTLNAAVSGLVGATVTTKNVPKTADQVVDVTVPAGVGYLRFATYDADYPAGTDVDLAVTATIDGQNVTVGSSGGATAEESVNVSSPPAGVYHVSIDYFAGATDTLDVKLNDFQVTPAAAGNMTVSPATQPVTSSTPTSVTVTWSDLDAQRRYLGYLTFSDGTSNVGRTLVNVLP